MRTVRFTPRIVCPLFVIFLAAGCNPGGQTTAPSKQPTDPKSDEKDKEKPANSQAARKQSADNLKTIGAAIHAYHDAYKHFPAHAICSADFKTPLLSWRIAILPYLGQEKLYKEFKLDEPWDSKRNKALIAKMPKVYAGPSAPAKVTGDGKTYYQVFTSELGYEDGFITSSIFPQPSLEMKKDGVPPGILEKRIVDITDGTSNTIMAAEARDPVIWTKPDDLYLPRDKQKIPAVGGLFENGFHGLFCDGHVEFFRPDPFPDLLRQMITPMGGEVVEFEQLRQDEK